MNGLWFVGFNATVPYQQRGVPFIELVLVGEMLR